MFYFIISTIGLCLDADDSDNLIGYTVLAVTQVKGEFNGADLRTVQAIAGHSSIKSTEIYLHTQDKKMALAAQLL